ncbi:hypothetical protein PROVRETT_06018 [Providencia rettgeri DSM 1131]|uniref:hypothetical protein n=1 Tax=Providencia rettgeri TaxID=587 RepID=UPI000197CA1D|nr:hypothetical protein [Providencia rettgeri]EFE55309.1 hypothetical protein PROVRETT_06018 [Providencia rettgeri DSM 1131]QXA59640.1 hypothetical protein I6L79_09120 [Providencia rettgeri]
MAVQNYSEEQLFTALRNADAAGDVDGAKRIAGMIKQSRSKPINQITPEEQKRQDNIFEDANGFEKFMMGAAKGVVDVANAMPWAEELPENEKAVVNSLTERMEKNPSIAQSAGEFVGQTAPFISGAGLVNLASSTAGRLGIASLFGAGEGAVVAKANNSDPTIGATIGAVTGPLGELAAPYINRAGQAVFNKVTGRGAANAAAKSPDAMVDDVIQSATKATDNRILSSNQKNIESFAQEVKPDQKVLDAARRLGMEDSLTPGMYSENPAYRAFENAVSSTPGNRAYHNRRDAIERLGNEADRFINDFGGDLDKSLVNAATKNRYTALRDGLEEEANRLYNQVEKAIPIRATVDTSNTMNAIENFGDNVAGLEAMKKLFPAAEKTLSLLDPNTLPNYGRLDRVRMMIGEAKGKKAGSDNPFRNMAIRDLNMLYAAMTRDQEAAAFKYGAADLWNEAKGVARQQFAVQDAMIANLGKDTGKGIIEQMQKAVVDMSQGKGSDFRKLVNNLPDDVLQNVVVTSMNKAFTTNAKSPGQSLGVDGFVKWYNGMLRNKTNMQALSRAIGYDASKRLRSIYDVAKGINRQNSERVYSSSQIDKMMNNFAGEGGALSKLYGIAKKVVSAEAATTSAGLPGSGTVGVLSSLLGKGKNSRIQAADDLITSSTFKNISKIVLSKETTPQQRKLMDRAISKLPQYRRWLETIPKEEAENIRRAGIVSLMTNREESEK